MTTQRDLAHRFARLRADEARDTPAFSSIMTAARGRRPALGRPRLTKPWWVLGGAVAAAAVLTAGVVFGGGRHDLTSTLLSQTSWEAPSDFLLETPDAAYLSHLPAIISPNELLPNSAAEEWSEP